MELITCEVIEAEVRYAVRHEYAQTAVDVIARRCRLAFLNSQAALDVLPRVVDIMSEELGWNSTRRKEELDRGVDFLQSMGLTGSIELEPTPRTWIEWAKSMIFGWRRRPDGRAYTRAQFEPGEVDALRTIFKANAQGEAFGIGSVETRGQPRLRRRELLEVLHRTSGYEKIRENEFYYILDEAGFSQRDDFDFDEFVEVRCLPVHSSVCDPSFQNKMPDSYF